MDTPTAPTIHLHQIAYSADTLAAVEPGYVPLDNLANPRPDWYEYWPIRSYLLNQPLDDNAFYGFFSPKFGRKTQLDCAAVRLFVQRAAPQADVVLFSPQPDMSAFFMNVFEQGDTFDPELSGVCSQFLERIGRAAPIKQLVMDSRQIIFSNYFVARPAFWREWLAVNEALFAICEGEDSPLKDKLNHRTTYRGQVPRKVFVMERMASLLLATQPRWRTKAANPFTMGWSKSRLCDHPFEAVMSDALKIAFRDQRFPHYIDAYFRLREQMHEATNAAMAKAEAAEVAAAAAAAAVAPVAPSEPASAVPQPAAA